NKENGIISAPFKYLEGHSVYEFYLREYAGVDMMTGQALYYADNESYDPAPPVEGESKPWYEFLEEVNGETYNRNASYATQVFSGSARPTLMGAFITDLSYKERSLCASCTY